MAAITPSSTKVTEFGGAYKVAVVSITATTSTNDTVTLSEFDTIVGAVATPAAATTAACQGLAITGISDNVITVQANEGDGTICTQTPIAFTIVAVGYNS